MKRIKAGSILLGLLTLLFATGDGTADDRRQNILFFLTDDESWLGALMEQDVGEWWDLIELQLGRGGLMDTGSVARFIEKTVGAQRFGDLQIPLAVVAADFWERQQVVFQRGPLAPAAGGLLLLAAPSRVRRPRALSPGGGGRRRGAYR